MKTHLFQSKDGLLHLCDKTKVSELRDSPTLVWTKCEIDVPANTSFESEETATCPKCLMTPTPPRSAEELAEEHAYDHRCFVARCSGEHLDGIRAVTSGIDFKAGYLAGYTAALASQEVKGLVEIVAECIEKWPCKTPLGKKLKRTFNKFRGTP